ncbi:16S rRNA (cytosine(967)-C(5))-methyltransferase RsmB [Thalassotalea profundi]|uniref:16S rRNA (cytosine(967)-C(5))-methyltransferase n=1 Tax=Thalassotalea profundi TaxID=2036687 RepID=A0ABQ3IXT2_9GAMM|nr:16S rRNA (cytosine(967)-C(5))-methyltransferase RsmB [Thalassotalea profundi]GHE96391.1 ribosomal RNA small subunit methyltransferase B [Thalassotalea profundi]
MAINIRAAAAKCVFAVIDKGRSLSDELPLQISKIDPKDKGLLQECCYGVLRVLPELEHEVRSLMDKPLVGKQRVAHFLLLVGLYQLKYMRIPDHACVAETVAACPALKCNYLKGLVNAILRNFLRKEVNNQDNQLPDAIKYNHPGWFIKKLQVGYPNDWQDILAANQIKPPMWIRVNRQHHSIKQYLALLTEADISFTYVDEYSGAILLSQAVDVYKLPGFELGHVSIQDGAAQQAAVLLDCQPNDNVLDCCAAPGGKTCHILERTPTIDKMTAIDIEESRLTRVKENLTRLNLSAEVITADAAKQDWWNGEQFDRILLDAPCSGTGVIRRHPDIKWLRKSADIDVLTKLQRQILKNCWSLLKPNGTLLYATCSILPEENRQQVQRFIEETPNAELINTNENQDIGWQILSGKNNMDGFYYALIKKNHEST